MYVIATMLEETREEIEDIINNEEPIRINEII